MTKTIGFRCPLDVSAGIEKKMELTGRSKTTVILEMIKGLPGLSIEKRKQLPPISAIYLVWTDKELLYVGKTINVQNRFLDHHRLIEFLNSSAKVSWFDLRDCDKLEIEWTLIENLEIDDQISSCRFS